MDVTALEARIREELSQTTAANSRWGSTLLLAWMNQSARHVVLDTECLADERTAPAVVGQREYSLPSDLLRIKSIYYKEKKLYPITVLELDEKLSSWRDSNNGTPKYYFPMRIKTKTKTIGVYPEPDATETLRLFMLLLPATLVNATDEPDLPEEFHWAIIYRVCYMAAQEIGDKDSEGKFWKEYIRITQQLEKSARLMDQDVLTFAVGSNINRGR